MYNLAAAHFMLKESVVADGTSKGVYVLWAMK